MIGRPASPRPSHVIYSTIWRLSMTTKKTRNSKASSVQTLGLDDLDQVVGGAAAPAPATHPHDPSQDQAFLNTLGNVAAVVSANATASSPNGILPAHETVQAAINKVEADAQAQHISTTAALTDLLGATHGNQTVAAALTANLVNGTAEAELVNLAASGSLKAADVANIVQVATGTLAAYSKDGHSALGMSQNAAIDVIDAKIDTAAQAALTTGHMTAAFVNAFESQNASQLNTAESILTLEGGATALQTGLNAVVANPLQTQSTTLFGEMASLADAFSGQATRTEVNNILLNSSAVVKEIESVAQDLTLALAESVAQTSAVQQTLATEMTTRLVNGTAESELVNLAATGSLKAADVTSIVQGVTGTLAGLSADGHSALGMSQNAAIDVIDAQIDAAAKNALISADFVGVNFHSTFSAAAVQAADVAATNLTAFIPAFESQNASHLAAEQSIVALEGGAAAFQTGLNAAANNPLQAQSASVFGETASLADAFSGKANATLVNQILASSGVVSQLAQVAQDGTLSSAGLANLENAAAAAHVSTDLTLAVAETVAHTSAVQLTLATEMTSRLVNGTAETELVNLATHGSLQIKDVNTIVNSVTGALAGLSDDGHSALGMSQNAAIDVIDSKIDTAAQAALTTGANQLTFDQYQLASAQQAEAQEQSFIQTYGSNMTQAEHVQETINNRHKLTAVSFAETAVQSDQAAVSNMTAFVSAFEKQNASQLTAEKSIAALVGAADLRNGLNDVVNNPLQAQNADPYFGETATIADAFAGNANYALANATTGGYAPAAEYKLADEIIAASQGFTGLGGSASIQTNDLALALADEFATSKTVHQTLDTELTTRIDNGALVGNIVNLAGQGQLSAQAAVNIVSTVTGVLAAHSADGNTVAGTTQAAESAAIYENIQNQVLTQAINSMNSGNTLIGQLNFGAANAAYVEQDNLVLFATTLESQIKA